ncbi:MAG: 3-deoxy-D-manno-octulosonic acid transferase [Holophagaceae bacterium]|nr:3-deoxy-D-manno-octulosonic acid transferase [Holophagaceae bacterium]
MMPSTDAAYIALVSLAAAGARALRRGLPLGWRLRLEASPPENLQPGWVWLHAVSVGELILAKGLAEKLLEARHRVHLTTGTAAGLALLGERIPAWDQGRGLLSGGAFPVDDPEGLRPFLRTPPGAFIALETELWPNLLRQLEGLGVPRIIVNGRLTARSSGQSGLGGLGRPWLKRAAERLSLVAARDAESADAFRSLGAPKVALGGNLKADLPSPAPLAARWEGLRSAWQESPVLVAGSTLEGEEALVLEAWMRLRSDHPSLRLILAPRQPKRFQPVAELLREQGHGFLRASGTWPEGVDPWRSVGILLLDTLGELPAVYGEGTVALVGGGWRGKGGHNPLEPVRWGIPTLIGPGFHNFEDLVGPLRAAHRLNVVEEPGLEAAIQSALETAPLRGPGWGGTADLPEGLAGALETVWNLLRPYLPAAMGPGILEK